MLQKPECPVCGCTDPPPKKNRATFQVVSCKKCSLAYMHPLHSGSESEVDGSNSSITNNEYYSKILQEYEKQSILAKEKAPKMLSYWKKFRENKMIRSVLEIGCGTGQYYKAFSDLGIEWTGLEVNSEMIKFCLKKNIPVIKYSNHINSKNKYDIIFLSQVLEHILDPNTFLTQLHKFMTEDTILHIDVPNHDSITSLYRRINIFHHDFGFVQPPHHQIAYTKKAMAFLMINNSSKIMNISGYTNDHPIFGQLLVDTSVLSKVLFFLSNITNRGSLLVCVAKKA